MSSLCEICGRVYCDHTSTERGLTPEQWEQAMSRELTPDEKVAFQSGDTQQKIRAARIASSKLYGKIFSLPGGGMAIDGVVDES